MTWIYALPSWLFMLLAVLAAAALAAAGLQLFRNISPNDQITHNDVAGPVLTTIGTLLAVMLSFMVAGVWQEYDQASQWAQTEASAISDLHHLADALPNRERTRLQEQLDRYAVTVVEREWPLMRQGRLSFDAQHQAYAVQSTITHFQTRTPFEQSLQDRALSLATIMLDARRDRILANRTGIPMVLWAAMLFMSCLTIAFSYFFRVPNVTAHRIMAIALCASIAVTIALIAELDYPFRGDIAVQPSAFREVLNLIHEGATLHCPGCGANP